MPCYTVRQVSVEMGKVDIELLKAALLSMGVGEISQRGNDLFWYRGSYTNGKLTVSDTDTITRVKKSYTAENVKASAKRYGWKIKQTAAYEYELIK
jgi:hypothetical protein